jgi:flagellar motor switch protein FliN/FliY
MEPTKEQEAAEQEPKAPSPPETTGDAGQGPQASPTETAAGTDSAYEFSTLNGQKGAAPAGNLDFILDVPLQLTVELGRTKMMINDLLRLGHGSVIELSKLAGETLDILANQRLIARGEVVVIKEKYGIRITEIISPAERVEKLG